MPTPTRTKKAFLWAGLMTAAVGVMLAIAGASFADNFQSDGVVSGGPTSITAGESATVTYRLVGNSGGGDPVPNCNVDSTHPATVTVNAPAGVSASPSSFQFSACGNAGSKTVSFSSSTPDTYSISHGITGGKTGALYTNQANFTLQVNALVQQNTAPGLSVPAPIIVEAGGASGATVNYSVTATDTEDNPDPTPSCSPVSGSLFPLGTTQVNCSVTDSGSLTTTGSFDVTVVDATAPALNVPSDVTAEATGPSGAVVSYTASASDLVDGAVDISCSPASGSTFALGTTHVSCSATDAAENTALGGFDVTVEDTTPPALSLPSDVTVEATGPSGAVVSYTASASDLVDGAVDISCSPASGSTFALGTTTVECSASDVAGNSASGGFDVTVEDTTAPALNVPSDVTVEATGPSGAVVSYTASASDLVDGAVDPSCSPVSGSTFALGTTHVSCSATDAAENTALGGFDVTVEDTTPPALSLPSDVTVEATGPSGAAVSYTASASDLVDGAVDISCSPASGSTFALGTTTVQCSATDAHSNNATGSFSVTVEDTTAPSLNLPANITTPATSMSGALLTYPASASDLVDGSVPVSCSPASGSMFAPGPTTVTCSATDAASNTATGSFTVTVKFSASGFYQPVDMTPATSSAVWNTVKNGSTVPLKFEVFAGSSELTDIAVVNQPLRATGVTCGGGTADDIELIATGGTSLRYDTSGGQFIYNWQTPRRVGACYLVTVSMIDGSSLSAYFKLR